MVTFAPPCFNNKIIMIFDRREFQQLQDEVRRLRRKLRELQDKQSQNVEASPAPGTEVIKASETEQPVSSPVVEEISASQAAAGSNQLYKGYTIDQLKDSISNMDKLYDCVHCICLKLFDKDYIISHSVSGQWANSTAEAKPKFDERLFGIFIAVIKTKFPQVAKKDITGKIQAVQEKYCLIKKKNGL